MPSSAVKRVDHAPGKADVPEEVLAQLVQLAPSARLRALILPPLPEPGKKSHAVLLCMHSLQASFAGLKRIFRTLWMRNANA